MVPPPDSPDWEAAKAYWLSLHTDEGAKFDKEVIIDGRDIPPTVTWGTSPQDTVAVTGVVPNPEIDAGGDEQRKKGTYTLENEYRDSMCTPQRCIVISVVRHEFKDGLQWYDTN